jgi:hypothetical protein
MSRWRVTCPEEAGMGLVPARAAKAASERNRPACDQLTSTCAALRGPTPGTSSSHGAAACTSVAKQVTRPVRNREAPVTEPRLA